MHTIEQLRSGQLIGEKRIKISCGLKEFPDQLYALSDTLECLDLSGNQLSSLPDDFYRFEKLKILFLSDNDFKEIPAVLSKCKNLEMIGFKANQIEYFPEDSIPITTRWLILTNNRLTGIPKSIGKCSRLQKCMLAGNSLSKLPAEMAHCHNLELLRISANKFEVLPEWLFQLPRLSWLAFAGNLFNQKTNLANDPVEIDWLDLEIKEKLGEGASGVIYKGFCRSGQLSEAGKEVAVKIFKGEVTSDGLPSDEMDACIAAGLHPNVIAVLAKIKNHPEQKAGLILELISSSYKNLGGPPSLASCTRDTYDQSTSFSLHQVISIAKGIASAAAHLHKNGINHGDLYAHNILVNQEGHALFGDFGAATFYDVFEINALDIQKIEVRAFGYLLDDLLQYMVEEPKGIVYVKALHKLKDDCLSVKINERPTFDQIYMNILDVENC